TPVTCYSIFFLTMLRPQPRSTLFPYTTLFRSSRTASWTEPLSCSPVPPRLGTLTEADRSSAKAVGLALKSCQVMPTAFALDLSRSEEHTSELQSRGHLVCRLLLEKKKLRANNS